MEETEALHWSTVYKRSYSGNQQHNQIEQQLILPLLIILYKDELL